MKRYILALVLIILFAGALNAQVLDTREALTGYNPIYFLFGFTEEDQVKIQLSFKYNLSYPYTIGFYLAYSQIMFWKLYELSGPFEELNYSPELFWRFESGNNFLDNIRIVGLDYFQAGWKHLSNGKDGIYSRGYDTLYGQLQISVGSYINGGVNFKYFYCFPDIENSDIQNYIGSTEIMLFLKYRDHYRNIDFEEMYFKFGFGGGANSFSFQDGWQELGIKFRTIFSRFRPYLQIYRGYAESLIYYNYDRPVDLTHLFGLAARIGIIIE